MYTKFDAYDDAIIDAVDEFTDNLPGTVRDLIAAHAAGQYRDDVERLIEDDDDATWKFISRAWLEFCAERYGLSVANAIEAHLTRAAISVPSFSAGASR